MLMNKLFETMKNQKYFFRTTDEYSKEDLIWLCEYITYLINKSEFSNWGVFNLGSRYSWIGMGGKTNNEKWYN